jgi:8-oxo-dGTP diphosphatase
LFEEFGVDAIIANFFMESVYQYDNGSIRLLAYFVADVKGDYVATVHDEIRWVDAKELLEYDLAPADIPIAEELIRYLCEGE